MAVRDFPQRSGNSGDSTLDQWLDLVCNRLNLDDQIELTAVADGDELGIFDVSADAFRKITKANLTAGFSTGITLGTEQATTSGTSITFTGIPAGVKRITGMIVGSSSSGTSNWQVQIGDAGGLETSGYSGVTSNGGANPVHSAGFILSAAIVAAATYGATFVLSLEDSANFTWSMFGILSRSDGTGSASNYGSGSKSLSAELTQIRLTTVNGTDTFDAGAINISYE